MYDYLIVGAGLYGAVFAHEAKKAGKKVLVIDRRPNIAGNVYTEDVYKRQGLWRVIYFLLISLVFIHGIKKYFKE